MEFASILQLEDIDVIYTYEVGEISKNFNRGEFSKHI